MISVRVETIARAIAGAHYDKITLRKHNKDRDMFAEDWWFYFVHEAKEACTANDLWQAQDCHERAIQSRYTLLPSAAW